MDFPIPSQRVETAPVSNAVLPPNTNQLSTQAETARPVMGADSAQKVRASEVEPLDMYAVGDNDRIPVPPEPPRPSAVMAVIASAPEVKAEDTVEDPAPKEAPLSQSLREVEEGPENPTVDIRR